MFSVSFIVLSFQSIGLSSPWLSLFPGVLFFVIQLWMGVLNSLCDISWLVYGKMTKFCTLILYPKTLVDLFLSSNSFFGGGGWLLWLLWGKSSLLGLSMAVFSLSLQVTVPLCVCHCALVFPFYKDTSHTGWRPTLMTLFELVVSSTTLFSNKVIFSVTGD